MKISKEIKAEIYAEKYNTDMYGIDAVKKGR